MESKEKQVRKTLKILLQTNDPSSTPFIRDEDEPKKGTHLMSLDEIRTINFSDLVHLANLLGMSDLYTGGNDGAN